VRIPNPNAMTVTETAALMRCSKSTVYSAVKAGTIPYHRFGKLLRFFEEEVMAATKPADTWARSNRSAAALGRRQIR
jgi:excisionase family DNA binding protein